MEYPTLHTNGQAAAEGEPTLVLCFAHGGRGPVQLRPIPRQGLVIGRSEAVFDTPFRDPEMSARHASIRMERKGRVVLTDLHSDAGTRVNGEMIDGDHVLEPGDVIRCGDALMVYALASYTRPAPADALGTSDAMRSVTRSIEAVAPRKHTVVITGETGTGKEIVARMIHDRSGRSGPFIAVNCSTFTESLLPSELFGHVRGAFTGAVAEHPGLFRAARGGTLLLDELADIPMSLQASLLRVLEAQEVRPVGGTRDIGIDVRVIATVNTEIRDLVQAGKFRADLYARLAQWTVRLPRLAERREDIPGLVAGLLPRVDGGGREISPDLGEALLVHEWPLNVRGLLNILSIAVVSTESERGPLLLTNEVLSALWSTRSMTAEADAPAEPARATLDREELEELMIQFKGHVAAAGRHVGMTRSKLYRLLEAHGMEPGNYRESLSRPQGGQPGTREPAPDVTPVWQHRAHAPAKRLQHSS
jgi:transcriptional regulator of acetoin/glycerol metabolism